MLYIYKLYIYTYIQRILLGLEDPGRATPLRRPAPRGCPPTPLLYYPRVARPCHQFKFESLQFGQLPRICCSNDNATHPPDRRGRRPPALGPGPGPGAATTLFFGGLLQLPPKEPKRNLSQQRTNALRNERYREEKNGYETSDFDSLAEGLLFSILLILLLKLKKRKTIKLSPLLGYQMVSVSFRFSIYFCFVFRSFT